MSKTMTQTNAPVTAEIFELYQQLVNCALTHNHTAGHWLLATFVAEQERKARLDEHKRQHIGGTIGLACDRCKELESAGTERSEK